MLDDYHVITAPEIHDSVAFLLEHLPPQLSLVIVTRADPPLPLASLRADGDLLEVRAADLRFTADEAVEYLNGAMELTLTTADVDVLEARTEGWIAAFQLAALSMQGRDDPSSFVAEFAGDDRFILDYLADEVLDRQTARSATSCSTRRILSRLTGSLCAAVTGQRRRQGHPRGARPIEHVPRSARRSPHVVPVPPPLRRRRARQTGRRAARPGRRAAPPRE